MQWHFENNSPGKHGRKETPSKDDADEGFQENMGVADPGSVE